MKRRTLDLIVSVGGLVLAGLLLIVGLVLTSNANFANNYVHDQLAAQKISFKTADTLTAEEKQQACLVQCRAEGARVFFTVRPGEYVPAARP